MQEAVTSRRNPWRQWIWSVGFVLALLALTFMILQASRSARRAEAMREFLSHTGRVLSGVQQLETLVTRTEADQRGYLITGAPDLLRSRETSYAQSLQAVAQLRGLLRHDGAQTSRIDAADQAIEQRHSRMLVTSAIAENQGLSAARSAFDQYGSAGFETIRQRLNTLRDAEQQRLVRYTTEADASARRFNDILSLGSAIALLLMLACGVALWMQNRHGETLRGALARSDALQRAILDSAGLMMIAVDPQGVITVFNQAARETLGYDPKELTGQRTLDVFHLESEIGSRALELTEELDTPVPPGYEVLVAKARRGGTDVGRWTFVRRDGSRLRVQLAVSAVRDPDGELRGFVALAQDVTEHELAHERLLLSEQRTRAIIETASDAFIAIDRGGRIEDWNAQAERMLGWSREEALGGLLSDLLIPERYRSAHRDGMANYIATGHGPVLNRRIEISALDRSGREFPIELTIWPIRSGDHISFNAFLQDITERKQAEDAIRKLNTELTLQTEQLAETNRELEGFSYSVSHDLRAPLRHMGGYAQILREEAGKQLDPSLLRYIDEITASSRRMGTLIDDLLAFSRLGRQMMTPIEIDMNAIVASALGAPGAIPNRQARIDVAPLPKALGDPVLLRQVWTNLLSNAVKYSAPRGSGAVIRIDGERDADVVRYRVRDNGVGFDPRYADKLFGVFQRLHSQDDFEGTGVGLAIVQRIIARHRGRVSAKSEPGRGAEFVFELPVT
ncbi:PAS domain S-box protein [Lysobacter tyrosinilyticus]